MNPSSRTRHRSVSTLATIAKPGSAALVQGLMAKTGTTNSRTRVVEGMTGATSTRVVEAAEVVSGAARAAEAEATAASRAASAGTERGIEAAGATTTTEASTTWNLET